MHVYCNKQYSVAAGASNPYYRLYVSGKSSERSMSLIPEVSVPIMTSASSGSIVEYLELLSYSQ